jgi:hypothetical protein
MTRNIALTVMISIAGIAGIGAASFADDPTPTVSTGWFSDKSCAESRVAKGEIGPNNPDCVKKCLEKGVPPVFISEQAKAMFEIRDYAGVKDDIGYYVEVTGTVDNAAHTIAVRSVKRLSYVGAICHIPKPKTTERK